MIHFLLLMASLFGSPDVSRRTTAWRVIDTYVTGQDCAQACGPVIDTTRDLACIQAAIDFSIASAPIPWREIELPGGDCYVEDQIVVANTWGLVIEGHGQANPGTTKGTTFHWRGDTVTPVFLFDDTRASELRDVTFVGDGSYPLIAAVKTINGAGSDVTPTANRFSNIYIDGTTGGGLGLIDGIWVSTDGAGGDNNQEFYVFRDVHVTGYLGAAFRFDGTQQKSMLLDHVACEADPALRSGFCVVSYGCFTAIDIVGGYNATDFDLEASGCPTLITANMEGSKKLLKNMGASTGVPSQVTLLNSRWSANGVRRNVTGTDRNIITSNASGGGLSIIGSTLGEDGAQTYTMTADAGTNVVTFSGFSDVAVDMPVYFTTSTTLPGGLSLATTYYVKTAPTTSTATLSATVGGATIDILDAGTGTHTAHIANAKPLAIYIGAGDGVNQSPSAVLINNFIGSSLRGTDLYPYWFPSVSLGNTIENAGYDNDLQGYAGPMVLPLRISGTGATVDGGSAWTGGNDTLILANSATAVTSITGGVEGRHLSLRVDSGTRTLTNNSEIVLSGAQNFAMAVEDSVDLIYTGGAWHETGRSGASLTTDAINAGVSGNVILTATTLALGSTNVTMSGTINGSKPDLVLKNDYVNTTPAGTAGYETMSGATVNIGSSLLGTNGDSVEFEYVVNTVANTNQKEVQVALDGTALCGDSFTTSGVTIRYTGTIWRTASNTANYTCYLQYDASSTYQRVVQGVSKTWSTSTLDLTLDIYDHTSAGDARLQFARVVYAPKK